MDEMDGIETAMQIRSFHSQTYVILVTAFIDYVLEGYKVNAIRYIMKDTMDSSVAESMDAILERMELRQVSYQFLQGSRRHVRRVNNYEVELDLGVTLPVPRLRFQSVKEAFIAYKGVM